MRSDAKRRFYHDVFVTALEGGIGYWSTCLEYHWHNGEPALDNCDLDGFFAVVEDDEEGGDEHRIDRAVIMRGVGLITSGKVQLRSDLIDGITRASRTNDAGEIDAEGADCIVQAGLFGEVVYG